MRALIILLTPLLFQVSYAEKKKIQPMESCSQIRKSTNHMVARIKEYCGSKKGLLACISMIILLEKVETFMLVIVRHLVLVLHLGLK